MVDPSSVGPSVYSHKGEKEKYCIQGALYPPVPECGNSGQSRVSVVSKINRHGCASCSFNSSHMGPVRVEGTQCGIVRRSKTLDGKKKRKRNRRGPTKALRLQEEGENPKTPVLCSKKTENSSDIYQQEVFCVVAVVDAITEIIYIQAGRWDPARCTPDRAEYPSIIPRYVERGMHCFEGHRSLYTLGFHPSFTSLSIAAFRSASRTSISIRSRARRILLCR